MFSGNGTKWRKGTDIIISLAIEVCNKNISRKNLLVLKHLCPAEALNNDNFLFNANRQV